MTNTRVRYREQQTLGKNDLSDEQAYRTAMRRRHNLAHHAWGIVEGFELVVIDEEPVLQPGMAIDGYGRELIVPSSVSLEDAFNELGCDKADIWLLYGLTPVTPPQRGRWDCGPGQHSRWQEEAVLRLKPANTDPDFDPRKPFEVALKDQGFGPAETPPDDPAAEWPVYLGTVDMESKEVDISRRPYVRLIGESVSAPSGKTRIQVGSEDAGDKRRFAVQVADDVGSFTERLVIDRNGDASIHGNVILDDVLVIHEFEESEKIANPCAMLGREQGQAETVPPPGIEFEPLASAPAEAAPWQIYHVELENIEEGKNKSSIHQLRFEIGNPGDKGDPKRNLLAIGYWDREAFEKCKTDHCTNYSSACDEAFERCKDAFRPCLNVNADCTVVINGNLKVEGEVVESAIEADPNDPEFRDVIEARWMQGIAETGTTLLTGSVFSELDIIISTDPTSPEIGHELNITFTVQNNGHLAVSDVTVNGTIFLTNEIGEVQTKEFGPCKIGDLESEDFSAINELYTPAQTGELKILATVYGVNSTSAYISAWASATVSVNSGGPY